MVRVTTLGSAYDDCGAFLALLAEQGYEARVDGGTIVVLCEQTDDPNSPEADAFLEELRIDVPAFVVEDVWGPDRWTP